MKRTGLVMTVTGIIILAALALTPIMSQAGSFLKIDGVFGESRDAYHPGWIDVKSYQWLTAVPPVKVGGSAQGGEGSLVVTKMVDRASTMLSAAASSKAPYGSVTLTFPSRANPDQYLKYTLKNVMITSYSVSGSGGEDRIAVAGSGGEDRIAVGGSGGEDRLRDEVVTFHFRQVQVEYTNPTGIPIRP